MGRGRPRSSGASPGSSARAPARSAGRARRSTACRLTRSWSVALTWCPRGGVESIFDVLREINRSGVSILLVEQNVQAALTLSHRAYLLEAGRVAGEGSAAVLLEDPRVRRAYLGPLAR